MVSVSADAADQAGCREFGSSTVGPACKFGASPILVGGQVRRRFEQRWVMG
jgi:hypothetical protein